MENVQKSSLYATSSLETFKIRLWWTFGDIKVWLFINLLLNYILYLIDLSRHALYVQ